MDKILSEYRKQYTEAIKDAAAGDYVVPEELWIMFKYFTDKDTLPNEDEKVMQLMADLVEANCYDMIDTIGKGFSMFLKIEKEAAQYGEQ